MNVNILKRNVKFIKLMGRQNESAVLPVPVYRALLESLENYDKRSKALKKDISIIKQVKRRMQGVRGMLGKLDGGFA